STPNWSLFMGDHRAGTSGSETTTFAAPSWPSATSAETRTSQPYVGRRIAQVAPVPADVMRGAEALPYAGRRVAGRNPVVARVPADRAVPRGRRTALDPELTGLTDDADDVVGHLLRPTAPPTRAGYVGRRIARPAGLITEPTVVKPIVIPPPAD